MKSIFIKKLQLSFDMKKALSNQFEEFVYTPALGEGIRIIENSDDFISCHYLAEKIYSQDTYNFNSGEFEKIEFTRVECISFFVDFFDDTLNVIGNKQQASRIIEFFGKVTRYKIPIGDVAISPLKLLERCSQNNVTFNIRKVKITDYTFFDNIIGDCVLNLFEYSKPLDVIRKYESQIAYISISITDDETYPFTFYKSGSVSIYKEIDTIDMKLLRLLKMGIREEC